MSSPAETEPKRGIKRPVETESPGMVGIVLFQPEVEHDGNFIGTVVTRSSRR